MNSSIFEGQVRHTRNTPVEHSFRYRVFMMYLDLDELPALFTGRWFWSTSRPALARFRRENHIGNPSEPLADTVRALVFDETGHRPTGPIRLLTNLSYFGYCFNPVSFYYCFDKQGENVEAIVAEVNNTPWGETDTYVLRCDSDVRSWRFQPVKKMHVSPFMPMDMKYDWVLSAPTEKLSVYMANSRSGEKMFSATLALERKPITGWNLASVLLRYPFMTAKVTFAIYWQALRLWLRKVPFYDHPEKQEKVALR
jgi:DUF1365 family protein